MGIQSTRKKVSAPKNLASTTSQSRTGAVSSISSVPSFNSSQKTRMVMSGTWTSSSTQSSGHVKKICITLCSV